MDVTEVIADILVAEGVDYLFGFPSNPLFDTGAVEDAGIETIIVRQERTGVHMADAVSRVTSGDEVGVFACQHGPARRTPSAGSRRRTRSRSRWSRFRGGTTGRSPISTRSSTPSSTTSTSPSPASN